MKPVGKDSKRMVLATVMVVAWPAHPAWAQLPVPRGPIGEWTLGNPAPGNMLATHATLLRNNKILVVSGSSYNCCAGSQGCPGSNVSWGKEETRLYDIASGSWGAKMTSPAPYGSDTDAFCSGHSHDDGNGVIFQGGLRGYCGNNGHGIANSARYDLTTGVWTQLGPAATHWYPTLVAGVRHVFLFPGVDTDGGESIQKLAYGGASWAPTGASLKTQATYPRVSLLPDGRYFIASPAHQDRKNRVYDPVANTMVLAGNDVVPESADPPNGPPELHHGDSWKGSGVLLPLVPSQGGYRHMRFALLNGVKAYVKDLAQQSPAWQPMGTRPAGLGTPSPVREFANSTLLPTGQVLVAGGVSAGSDATGVKQGEVYDPETNAWTLTPAATVVRNYHGVALLLPDGRVWTASSSQNHSGSFCGANSTCNSQGSENTEERVEIFTPWYHGRSDRPVVSRCPAKISTDGGQYEVAIGGSQGTSVGRVVLVRPGSVTHSFDTDQRLIQLDIVSKTAAKVTVKSPYGAAAAPPGDYMLFALRSIASTGFKRWVPSRACWTRVEPQAVRHNVAASDYQGVFDGIVSQGYRPVWVDAFEVGSGHRFNAVFTHSDIPWVARHGLDGAAYQTEFDQHVGQGFRLAQVDSYLVGGQIRYAAIWEKRPGPAWVAYHGLNQATHKTKFDDFVSQGYRPVNISAVNVGGTRFFTALYDKAPVGAFFTLTGLTEAQYQAEFNNQVNGGKRLAYVNAFMENGVPKISAIWNQSDAGAWVARHALDAGGAQTAYDNFIGQSYQTRCLAGYQSGGASRFAGLWTKK